MFDDKLEDGVTINVLFELDAEGVDDICTHVLKLSDETCREPEHVVFEVLVVTVVVSIASEKVTDVVVVRPAEPESAGEDEETVGAVVSTTNELIFNVTLLLELSVTVIVQFE